MRSEKEIRMEARKEMAEIEKRQERETEQLAEWLDNVYFSENSPLNK